MLVLAFGPGARAEDEATSGPRAAMVRTIESHTASAATSTGRQRLDPRVLAVMSQVPRHAFVPPARRQAAYADRPLPIGYGQTISQPFIVALMSDLLDPEPSHVVLEVGTGSGYQAAVLAGLVQRVCTIEIIPELGQSAAERLARLGYDRVEVRIGDGYYGWPDCGPFDGVVVTAAGGHVPPPLLQQLKPGGRLIMPIGSPFTTQQLTLVEKRSDGAMITRQLLPVAFVPLTRQAP